MFPRSKLDHDTSSLIGKSCRSAAVPAPGNKRTTVCRRPTATVWPRLPAWQLLASLSGPPGATPSPRTAARAAPSTRRTLARTTLPSKVVLALLALENAPNRRINFKSVLHCHCPFFGFTLDRATSAWNASAPSAPFKLHQHLKRRNFKPCAKY